MPLLRFVRIAVVLGAILILGVPGVRADQMFNVTIDTSSVTAGYTGPYALDFELTGSNGNTVTLSNFHFGTAGSAGPGSGFVTGSASGDLSGTITLNDSTNFLNDFNQQFTPGDMLSFTVDATTNGPPDVSSAPDNFSAVILEAYDPINGYDPMGLTGGTVVPTTDSTNDTIVSLDITTPQSDPTFYQVLPVPEPSSAALLMIGLFSTVAVASRRRAA